MTERSESERAELEALADEIEAGRVIHEYPAETLRQSASAIRRLAAQDQKPVAWRTRWRTEGPHEPGDWSYYNQKPPQDHKRYEVEPLHLSPPPAAGWDITDDMVMAAIRAENATCDENDMGPTKRSMRAAIEAALEAVRCPQCGAQVDERYDCCEVSQRTKALRHNAPPDSGAGESVTDLRIYCGDNPLKWAEEFCQIKQKQGWSVADIDENLMLGWFANAIEQSSDVRGCSALPDHGGADAGVVWRSISKDTSWVDGRDVVLLANDMEVQARYCPGEWCDETPSSPREYSGAVWSCFDDQFQLEIEECSEDPSEWGHDGATHWRPTSELPPTALPDHGGADAVVKAQIATLAHRFWTIHPRELQVKGMTREDFYIREMTALVAAISKPAPVAANASAENYRDAIDEALVTRFIGVAKGDAKAELNQIVEWDVAVALDPRVSSSAQALIDSGRNASAEARLREALGFYAREWQTNMEGDSETPGLSRCWREPTDNLLHDEGVRAREALSAHPHASDCDHARTFGGTALCGHGLFKNRCPECDGVARP